MKPTLIAARSSLVAPGFSVSDLNQIWDGDQTDKCRSALYKHLSVEYNNTQTYRNYRVMCYREPQSVHKTPLPIEGPYHIPSLTVDRRASPFQDSTIALQIH